MEVPKSMTKRSSSSSTSSNRRATAAKDASPKGEVWPAAEDGGPWLDMCSSCLCLPFAYYEDLLEKFSSPKDDIRVDVARLEAAPNFKLQARSSPAVSEPCRAAFFRQAPIRRASKSGIEVVQREPSPGRSPASPSGPSTPQEDDRLTVWAPQYFRVSRELLMAALKGPLSHFE